MMRKSILLAAVCVACVGTATAVDTWYWTRAVTCNEYKGVEKGYYGYTSQSAANFTNAVTGVAGLPVSGDFLLVQSAGGFGQDFGTGLAFGGVTVTANSSVEFISQGTLTMQAGGAGLVFSNNVSGVGTANGSIAFTGSGEAIVDVQNANQSFFIQKSFYGNANITLVKRGPGTVKNSEGYAPLNGAKTAYNEARSFTGNYYPNRKFLFGGVKLQGGTLKLCQYYWVFGCDFQFDGNGVTLAAMKFDKNDGADRGIHSLELQNGRIRETANVTDTTHRIYGEDARCWIHIFGDNTQDSAFSGKMDGAAGLIWDPTSSERSFTFSKTVSPSTGILVVSNGTVRVTDGAGFTALSSVVVDGATSVLAIDASAAGFAPSTPITLANGGKLDLEAGARVVHDALTVAGAAVVPGLYTGVAGGNGTVVSWISGAGELRVGVPPEGSATATWTAVQPGNASAGANWDGGVAPELGGGTTLVTVASSIAGSDDKAGMTLDRSVWFKGISADLPNWFTVSGANEFALGSGGLVAPPAKTFKLTAPTLLTAAQTWQVRNSGRIWIANGLSSFPGADLVIKGGSGSVEFDAASPSLLGGLAVTNTAAYVKQTGALGPASAPAAYFYSMPSFTGGITVDRDLWICKGGTINGTADKTLTFNGFVCSSNTSAMGVSAPAGSVVTFNKLFMSRNGGSLSGAGRIVFNDSVHFRDRPSMGGTVIVELHKDKNRLNGNMGGFVGGTLKCMAPYVITKANTIRQANDTAGNNADGSQNTFINAKDAFILDLNGFDQSIDQLAMHADGTSSGGHVTSASPAKLHLQTNKSWWPNHNYNQSFGSGYKSISTADYYGYEASDKGYWEDRITLSYEAASGMVRSMMRTSSSSGNVEVVSGTLVFLRRAKTPGETFDLKGGSSNPYPRFASEDGAWPNATQVTVKGGTLKLEHGKVFGRQTDVYLDGGTLQLEEGVSQRVHALYLDGVKQRLGVWGSAASAAPTAHKHAYLGGTGLLNVTGDAQGSMLVIR